jgi:hypothetical protein
MDRFEIEYAYLKYDTNGNWIKRNYKYDGGVYAKLYKDEIVCLLKDNPNPTIFNI